MSVFGFDTSGFFNDVRASFWRVLNGGEDAHCPCCNRYAKIYKRRIHMSAARGLIKLYRLGGDKQYVRCSDFILEGQAGPGDTTKMKHWGLVEPQALDENVTNKRTSGMWRLTPDGVRFVRGELRVPSIKVVYDDEVIATDGADISIQEALGDKFNYSELMAA